MSDPVRIVVGSGESAEIRVASSSESAEIRIPESGLIVGPPGPQGPAGADGSDGQDGTDGTTFTPSVDSSGNLSWTNDGGKQNPQTVNIKGPAGNDGNDGEDGEDGVSPTVTFSTITGGHTMTVTDKDHPSGQSINIMDGESGGGGTTDYDDLTDKPSINGTTLSGNKTAAQLGLGTYSKPSGGIPASDLASAVQTSLGLADSALQSVPSTYRTATDQDSIGATQDAAIGIVITGKRPSMAVTSGQYVIVRNSTISGITDGLYTANTTLSPSTNVTAANLMAVSNGGLNSLGAYVDNNFAPYNQIMVTGYRTYKMTLPSLSGHFVFVISSSLSRSAILYIVVQSNGDVAVEEIQKGSNFSYTLGTNQITFSTGATYAVYIKEIPIRGDPITVEPVS